jgi:predicted RNA binding protein YcfA (HicA-like mRNA interferase family)
MPKLRPLPASEVARLPKKAGFSKVRQQGSHMIFARMLPDGSTRTVPVPAAREIPVGTLKSIIDLSGLDEALFRR